MNRFAATTLLVTLSAAAAPAAAAVVVDNLTARPNPARSSKGYPPELEFEITIKDRGMARILGCDLALDFGDGTAAVQQRFMDGGPRKATIKHVYEKPGSYTVIARGRQLGGGRACDTERRVQVTVIGDTPPADSTAPKETPGVTANCPAGWLLVPGSQSGPRFKCRPDHPTPRIECQAGTKYFEQDGMIGCQ